MNVAQIHRITAGVTEKHEIRVVDMPRAEFLAVVDELLSYESFENLTSEIRPVAETIERFPFGHWIDPSRGCGCLVGEYLVATGEFDRYNEALTRGSVVDVEEALLDRRDGEQLVAFGVAIDRRVVNWFDNVTDEDGMECDDVQDHVHAVLIVD